MLTQSELGDLFVLRNAGNIIPTHGVPTGEEATIEYAVDGLGVRDIVVCGHSHCGAVKGLLNPGEVEWLPAVGRWLEHAQVVRRIVRENHGHLKGDRLVWAAVRENVLVQVGHLYTLPAVASRLVRGDLRIHAWVSTRLKAAISSPSTTIATDFSPSIPVATSQFSVPSGGDYAHTGSDSGHLRRDLRFSSRPGETLLRSARSQVSGTAKSPSRGIPMSETCTWMSWLKENGGWRQGDFWRETFAWSGSATPHVLPRVAVFGLISVAITSLSDQREALPVGPHEVAGAVMGLFLVLRTNAGYDRWWEARRLWGGIVNQSRNLAIQALSYGPGDPFWRAEVQFCWTIAFAHVSRRELRGGARTEFPRSATPCSARTRSYPDRPRASHGMPDVVARGIGRLLRQAYEAGEMSDFAFHLIERERASLIDHLGGCERILKTPLARVYSIKIRRFVFMFLVSLTFAMLDKFRASNWMVPLFLVCSSPTPSFRST